MKSLRLFLALVLLGSFQSQAAGLPTVFQKPWCEGWLRKEPPEIKAFKEDLTRNPQAHEVELFWKEKKTSADYTPKALSFLKTLFQDPRYRRLNSEVRSRLIAYALVAWLRVPVARDFQITSIIDFLNQEIASTQYSAADLERLRLAFRIVLIQRTKWWTKAGHDGFRLFMEGLFPAMGDAVLACLYNDTGPLTYLVPHSGFIPLPISLTAIASYNLYKYYFGNDLLPETVQAAHRFEDDLVGKTSERLGTDGLKRNWKTSIKILLTKSNSIQNLGSLQKLVSESCKTLGERPGNAQNSLALLRSWAADIAAVNAVDSDEILRSFAILKKTARKIRLSSTDYAQISVQLQSRISSWIGNESAREDAQRFLDSPYDIQALPQQDAP